MRVKNTEVSKQPEAEDKWWVIKEFPDWNREMTAFYKLGLEDGYNGSVRKEQLTFQACYDEGYSHGCQKRSRR